MTIPTSQLRRLLRAQGGEVRAGAGEDLLRQLLTQLGLRANRNEVSELRMALCEMAARGQIALEFDTDHVGSAPIVAVQIIEESKDEEITGLKRLLDEAYAQIATLQGTISANAGDVSAAEELVTEAQNAQTAAKVALAQLQRQYDELLAQRQMPPATAVVRRDDSTAARQLTLARARATRAEAQVAELQQQVVRLRVQLRGKFGRAYHRLTCGCVVIRTNTEHCRYGGIDHPFFPLVLPGMSHEDAQVFLGLVMTQFQMSRTGQDVTTIVVGDDTTPHRS